MTPPEIATQARLLYNAATDSFFSDLEIYGLIWAAEMDMARTAKVIEQTYSTPTVGSQASYDFPTNAMAVKRVTSNGYKLMPITQREDDSLTLSNSTTTAEGAPQYYWTWGRAIYLRPVPDTVYTLQVFSFDAPAQVSGTSTLEVPTQFHLDIIDYVLFRMSAKDKNYQGAQYYENKWKDALQRCIVWQRLQKRTDGFVGVQDQDLLPATVVGLV